MLTQIHYAYVAGDVVGRQNVLMDTQLDSHKIDLQINWKGIPINVQIKQFSRRFLHKKTPDNIHTVVYEVPSRKTLLHQKNLNGNYKKDFLIFRKNRMLRHLRNGFVVFKPFAVLSLLDKTEKEYMKAKDEYENLV